MVLDFFLVYYFIFFSVCLFLASRGRIFENLKIRNWYNKLLDMKGNELYFVKFYYCLICEQLVFVWITISFFYWLLIWHMISKFIKYLTKSTYIEQYKYHMTRLFKFVCYFILISNNTKLILKMYKLYTQLILANM